jgi:hypothetical protein
VWRGSGARGRALTRGAPEIGHRVRAAATNGSSNCGGSGTEAPSEGGVRTVTQPTFVVIAIATRERGCASRNAVPPTTFPV